jgi:predicted ATPase
LKKIVLTGGPCAGKTTVKEVLAREFVGKAIVVPEVATMLINGGFPSPNDGLRWSEGWQQLLEEAIFHTQTRLEQACELLAQERGVDFLICDRGLMDIAAYTPGGVPAVATLYGVDVQEVYRRYEAVIHLESLATSNPALYLETRKKQNAVRFETVDQAQATEHATRRAWIEHPRCTFLPGSDKFADKVVKSIEIVRSHLPAS